VYKTYSICEYYRQTGADIQAKTQKKEKGKCGLEHKHDCTTND